MTSAGFETEQIQALDHAARDRLIHNYVRKLNQSCYRPGVADSNPGS